jgi:hypothetical protein
MAWGNRENKDRYEPHNYQAFPLLEAYSTPHVYKVKEE